MSLQKRAVEIAECTYRGSCLCGKINYEIRQNLGEFGYCHCRSCRKASGSAHGANVGVDRANFRLDDPDKLLREFESSPGKLRAFCSRCGSPLYAYLQTSTDLVRVRLGSLDSEFAQQAKAHTFVSEKAAWDKIHGDLPQFAQWAPRDILRQKGSRQP